MGFEQDEAHLKVSNKATNRYIHKVIELLEY